MHKSHDIITFMELRRKPRQKLVDACQVIALSFDFWISSAGGLC